MTFASKAFVLCLVIASLSVCKAVTIQEFGDLTAYDVKVYDSIELHPPRQGGYRVATFNYPTLVEDENLPIGYIRVTNYAFEKTPDARAEIRFGGPGTPYVGLEFRAKLNAGINSRIEIFERHQ